MSYVPEVQTATFRQEVLESSLPVLVDFYATWCGPCRALSPLLDKVAAHYGGRLKVVKVNIDEEPELADYFRISGVPALYFFHQGRLVDQIVGLPAPRTLIDKLENIVAAPVASAKQVGTRKCCG